MTPVERHEIAQLNARLFGEDGQGGLAGEIQSIKEELAEWRGAIRLVRYGGSLLGIGGIAAILAALTSLAK